MVTAPKRPLTGYLRFVADIREEVHEETGLEHFKAAPEYSKRWQALSASERKEWTDKSAPEFATFKKKWAVYKKTPEWKIQNLAKRKKKLGKRPKDPNAPKQPVGSYFLFAQDKRPEIVEEHPEWGVAQVGKESGALWKSLSAEEKQPWIDRALKNREAYNKKAAKYKKTADWTTHHELVKVWKLKKAKLEGKDKKAKKPKKKKTTKKKKAVKKKGGKKKSKGKKAAPKKKKKSAAKKKSGGKKKAARKTKKSAGGKKKKTGGKKGGKKKKATKKKGKKKSGKK